MKIDEVLERLRLSSDPDAKEGMTRFGINTKNVYGISISKLRTMAKEIGRNHALAHQLWSSAMHEARILASMVDDYQAVSEEQIESWVKDFDSWDLCDQCCNNLFDKTRYAKTKAIEWGDRSEEPVKRVGFTLMATLAVHDKKARDEDFVEFLTIIRDGANNGRNFVKKAVNWALRQIGKRNIELNVRAIETARAIQKMESGAARWIAADAIRELTSEAIQRRLS